MRIGVAPHRLWPRSEDETDDVVEIARTAEELGFDHVIASGHLLAGDVGVTPDPLVLLSAVAGATRRIRLITSILVPALYDPVVLAHQTATLDRLSRGRLVLGVGTGWDRAEFAAVGVPFAGRGRRTDEHLTTVRRLWRGEDGTARLGVLPRTPGGPPLWVGGNSDAALRRTLRHGDAWHGAGVDPGQLVKVRERLTELAGEEERDPAAVPLTAGAFLLPPGFPAAGELPAPPLGGTRASAESVRDELGRLAEAGLSSVSLWLPVAAPALPDALAWAAGQLLSPRA
ncbi:LLM class flavin-dependent oxidoreductase [Streptomyces sp. NPDC052101]|uniref:LLM class flavin-dependent oxidoreductase n=1 Tax=Streptomyces sp. NPDC052101 TaxID=3155763 RepID=UPI003419790E